MSLRHSKYWIILCIAILPFVTACQSEPAKQELKEIDLVVGKAVEPPKEGDEIENFHLYRLDSKVEDLYGFLDAGNYVLLNFWATWCPPCLEELPSMEDLNQQWKGKLFTMIAASVDAEVQIVRDFLAQLGPRQPSFLILHDPNMSVAKRFGTEKFPETYLIGPNKRLIRKFVGARNWTSPETLLELEEAIGLKTQ